MTITQSDRERIDERAVALGLTVWYQTPRCGRYYRGVLTAGCGVTIWYDARGAVDEVVGDPADATALGVSVCLPA